MEDNIKEEIKKIEEKIKDLQAKAGDDIHMSLREAVQTEDMINMYQVRLLRLKEKLLQKISGKRFILSSKNDNKKKMEVFVTDGDIVDPNNFIVSRHSKLGKKLLNLSIGGEIVFNQEVFILKKIVNSN